MDSNLSLLIVVSAFCMFEYMLLNAYLIYRTCCRYSGNMKASRKEYIFLSPRSNINTSTRANNFDNYSR